MLYLDNFGIILANLLSGDYVIYERPLILSDSNLCTITAEIIMHNIINNIS